MGGRCIQCNAHAGSLENYGTEERQLCFSCASSRSCSVCGRTTPVADQVMHENKIYCASCMNTPGPTGAAAATAPVQSLKLDSIYKDEVYEDTGFFAPERKGIQKGALGGIIMMAIALVWFITGYAAGTIFLYPPILFVIGLYSLIKGLASGNIAGKKKTEVP
jgi:late competence protein required for DNA uptake (superfamily II DNA/RNA helicase)